MKHGKNQYRESNSSGSHAHVGERVGAGLHRGTEEVGNMGPGKQRGFVGTASSERLSGGAKGTRPVYEDKAGSGSAPRGMKVRESSEE